MHKIHLSLLKEQKERKILFSSTLSKYRFETEDTTRHELSEELYLNDFKEFEQRETNLKDDSFFNSSPFKYNIIRQ
tara:strand:+ start:1029 stop:1256 length:228 start_codon:yes stop_codon:yes gene_type:complete